MVELVTKSYGDVLFELAKEENITEKVCNELKEISEIAKENKEYMVFLTSPQIEKDEKIKTIDNIFSGKISPICLNFLKVLIKNGRISNLFSISNYFTEKFRDDLGIAYVEAITAVAMDDAQKQKLVANLETKLNKKVELNNIVNESLIGGMKIQIGEKLIDASVKTRLNDLQVQLSKN